MIQHPLRKLFGGLDPDPRSYCACGRLAVAKCQCAMNLCGSCWWRHGTKTGTQHQEGGAT